MDIRQQDAELKESDVESAQHETNFQEKDKSQSEQQPSGINQDFTTSTDLRSQDSKLYEQKKYNTKQDSPPDSQEKPKMKLLGLSCGSKDGNSEILLKEALMGAEELGVTVELLRIDDLNIPSSSMELPLIALTDDSAWFLEKVMECDALIISAPVYSRSIPGQLKNLADQIFGPRNDVAFKIKQRNTQDAEELPFTNAAIDGRLFKTRIGAFISVAGSNSPSWMSLSLPMMHTMTFSLQIAIVDQLQVTGYGLHGSVTLSDVTIKRARQLGRNVAEQIGCHFNDIVYKGNPGVCPGCHLDVIVIRDSFVECAVCGTQNGKIKIEDSKITVQWPQEDRNKSILELEGRRIHFHEIMEIAKCLTMQIDEISSRAKQYASYNRYVKPPKGKRTDLF